MSGKPDAASSAEWQEYYRAADKRRRRAGWRRADESQSRHTGKRRLDPARILAFGIGVATLAVVLCLVVPG
jgi:hypothetical protein